MKALVTGGAGFIGSHLVDALLDRGDQVVILDDLSTGKFDNVNGKAEFHLGCVTDWVWPSTGFVPDVIFHLAAQPRIQMSFTDPWGTLFVNNNGTLNVLEMARGWGARVVYAGSSTFYHDIYANPYAFAKWQGEELCRLYSKVFGVSTTIARFFNVYGKRQIEAGAYSTVIGVFEKQMRESKSLTVTGNGQQRRDFTHVSDIVRGLIAMSEQRGSGQVYNLGTGVNYSILEVAQMFGGPIEFIPRRPGEAWETLADFSMATNDFGWTPVRSLKDYIADWLK